MSNAKVVTRSLKQVNKILPVIVNVSKANEPSLEDFTKSTLVTSEARVIIQTHSMRNDINKTRAAADKNNFNIFHPNLFHEYLHGLPIKNHPNQLNQC